MCCSGRKAFKFCQIIFLAKLHFICFLLFSLFDTNTKIRFESSPIECK